MNVLTRFGSKVAFSTKKASPNIMIGAGIVLGGVSIGLAINSTYKEMDGIIYRHEKELDKIKKMQMLMDSGSVKPEEFNTEQMAQVKLKVKFDLVRDIFKAYWPTLVTAVAGASLILGGTHILNKRHATAVAAVAAIEESFRKYRETNREEIGEEKEAAIYKKSTDSIKELKKVNQPKDGHNTPSLDSDDVYGRYFDAYNINWTKDPSWNYTFLKDTQAFANQKLKACGHVFLNDVYRLLGYDDTEVGQLVGWRLNGDGDGFVDFGLPSQNDFDNELALSNSADTGDFELHFNVDGVIYHEI